MELLIKDLRFALRTLLRAPSFSMVVIISIALGFAAKRHRLQHCQWAAVGCTAGEGSGTHGDVLRGRFLFVSRLP